LNCASDRAPIGAIYLIDWGVGILDWAQEDNLTLLSIWAAAVRPIGGRHRCWGGLGEATAPESQEGEIERRRRFGLESFGAPDHWPKQL